MNDDLRSKVIESSQTAEKFIAVFYDSLDKRRHQMSRLYLDNAIMTWNGNGIRGEENIQKFIEDLPAMEHSVLTLGAQPVIDDAVINQKTLLLLVSGLIKMSNSSKPFQQTFVVTAQDDKWKIVNDCFRIQDALSTQNKKST